jgi:hypothetical protein
LIHLQYLKQKAYLERKRKRTGPEVDMFELYDNNLSCDDCIVAKREGDVSDGFFAEEFKKLTKVQEWQIEV